MTTVTDQQGRWVVSNVPTGQAVIQGGPNLRVCRTTVRDANYDAGRPSLYSFGLNVGSASGDGGV